MKKTMMNPIQMFSIAAAFCLSVFVIPEIANAETFLCKPTEVLEFSNRIHVRCSNTVELGGDTIRFLAIDKTDESKMARFTASANAALLSGKTFYVYVSSSAYTNVPGCLSRDCRTAAAFGLRK